MNTFGKHWTFTSFGESHGRAIGGVLDGANAGIEISIDTLRKALDRRAGRDGHVAVSARAKREPDKVEWLSGVIEKDGKIITLGTPVAFLIRNTDAHPQDYEWLKQSYRSGHADYTYAIKYGVDLQSGGGRSSARETAGRVVAGEIAREKLKEQGIEIHAELVQVGEEKDPNKFSEVIEKVRLDGDSIGGIVRCQIVGLPAGWGEPIFDKLQSHLAYAMLSINGCKGFDYGTGFAYMNKRGSEIYQGIPCPASGGIEGGISNGLPVVFRCVFKPTSSIHISGRHDACIAVRAAAVVEAMAALVIEDFAIEVLQTEIEH